jgi:AbrB family looped-hinge helix DNA binding protein
VYTIRVSTQGRMTIPKAIRDALGIRAATRLLVEVIDDVSFRVTLARKRRKSAVQYRD